MYFRNDALRKTCLEKSLKKLSFRKPFDSQHAKGAQTLPNFARQNFYHIFHHSLGNSILKCLSYLISEISGLFC